MKGERVGWLRWLPRMAFWGGMMGTSPAGAAVILTLSGTVDSSLIEVRGSGSVSLSSPLGASKNSSFLHLPAGALTWERVGNNFGDFLGSDWTGFGTQGRELSLSGDLRVEITGASSVVHVFETLRLDDDVSPGGDDLDLRFDGTRTFAADPLGVTVTLTGMSTVTLEEGNTFGDLISGAYVRKGWGDGGLGEVRLVIEPKTVPEPSVLGYAMLAGWLSVLSRRRKRGRGSG